MFVLLLFVSTNQKLCSDRYGLLDLLGVCVLYIENSFTTLYMYSMGTRSVSLRPSLMPREAGHIGPTPLLKLTAKVKVGYVCFSSSMFNSQEQNCQFIALVGI